MDTVEPLINVTPVYHGAEGRASVFGLVPPEAVKVIPPAYAEKFIYVEASGPWVRGDNRNEIFTDTTPIATPPPFVTCRVIHERNVIGGTLLNGIIIRPAWVIGCSGSRLGDTLFAGGGGDMGWNPRSNESCHPPGRSGRCVVKVVEWGNTVRESIFDTANENTGSTDNILAAVCEVS